MSGTDLLSLLMPSSGVRLVLSADLGMAEAVSDVPSLSRHSPDLGLGLHHGEQGGLLHQQVGLGGAHHLAQVPAHHQSHTFGTGMYVQKSRRHLL